MVIDLVRRVQDTQVFLKIAAIELRRISARVPDVAIDLQHVARELDAEAADLVAGISDVEAVRGDHL